MANVQGGWCMNPDLHNYLRRKMQEVYGTQKKKPRKKRRPRY